MDWAGKIHEIIREKYVNSKFLIDNFGRLTHFQSTFQLWRPGSWFLLAKCGRHLWKTPVEE